MKNNNERARFSQLEVYVFCIFVCSSLLVGYYSYISQKNSLKQLVTIKQESSIKLFDVLIKNDSEGLTRAMASFSQIEKLAIAFKEKDRDTLVNEVSPIFKTLKEHNNITHLYFIDKNGVVFLRAHKETQYGDELKRTTFLIAKSKHAVSCGIEMGMNYYSLRCVQPMYHNNEFIGYLEMAQEIDHLFQRIKETVQEDFSMLLNKEYLNKRNTSVDLYESNNFYLLETTNSTLVKELLKEINIGQALLSPRQQIIDHDKNKYSAYMNPFYDASGELAGVIMILRNITDEYNHILEELIINAALVIFILLGALTLIIVKTKRSMREIENVAYHDALTGIPNRSMFNVFLTTIISRAKRYEEELSLLFIDLDNFKIINDTLGHEAGDILLKEASTRIVNSTRDSDFVARLGGDEFVVILPQMSDHEKHTEELIETVALKILKSLEKEFEIYGSNYYISASIGASHFPKDATEQEELIKHADIAMYEAKESGKNTVYNYSSSFGKKFTDRLDGAMRLITE